MATIGSIIGLHPFNLNRGCMALMLLIATLVSAKFINGYLFCDYTISTAYLDLPIGIAMLVACGIIPLLAMAGNRSAKTIAGRWFSAFAFGMVVVLLNAVFLLCGVNGFLNLFTTTRPWLQTQSEAKLEATRLRQQLSWDEMRERVVWLCVNKTASNNRLINEGFGFRPDIPQDKCRVLEDFMDTLLISSDCQIHRLQRVDPFNVCAGNNYDAIKAMYRNDRATFDWIHRMNNVVQSSLAFLWMALFMSALSLWIREALEPPESTI